MGNKNTSIGHAQPSTKSSSFLKWHLNRELQSDNLNQLTQANDIRRCVFISIDGLSNIYQTLPFYTIWNSIMLLPIKSDWISDSPSQRCKHRQCHYNSGEDIPSQILNDNRFLELLRLKKQQKLLFCALDYKKGQCRSDDITGLLLDESRFWACVSDVLAALYDPSDVGNTYNALKLCNNYWKYESVTCSMLNNNANNNNGNGNGTVSWYDVLNEIHCVCLEYEATNRILIETNPSLRVIA